MDSSHGRIYDLPDCKLKTHLENRLGYTTTYNCKVGCRSEDTSAEMEAKTEKNDEEELVECDVDFSHYQEYTW